jgi:hypothetical protein
MVRKKNSSDQLDFLAAQRHSIDPIAYRRRRGARGQHGRSAITPARPPINLGKTMMTAMRHRTVDTNGIRRY